MKAPELTLVIPTFNEKDNIAPLLDLLIWKRINWELIFADDDLPDDTSLVVLK